MIRRHVSQRTACNQFARTGGQGGQAGGGGSEACNDRAIISTGLSDSTAAVVAGCGCVQYLGSVDWEGGGGRLMYCVVHIIMKPKSMGDRVSE